MNELFTIYEDSFSIVLKKVSNILDFYVLDSFIQDKQELALRDAEINLNESKRILKQMEIELTNKTDNKNYDRNIIKLKNYKITFDEVKKRISKIKDNNDLRLSLEESIRGIDDDGVNRLQNQKLIENEENKSNINFPMAKISTMNISSMSIDGLILQQRNISNEIDNRKFFTNKYHSIFGGLVKNKKFKKLFVALFSLVFLGIFLYILFIKFK